MADCGSCSCAGGGGQATPPGVYRILEVWRARGRGQRTCPLVGSLYPVSATGRALPDWGRASARRNLKMRICAQKRAAISVRCAAAPAGAKRRNRGVGAANARPPAIRRMTSVVGLANHSAKSATGWHILALLGGHRRHEAGPTCPGISVGGLQRKGEKHFPRGEKQHAQKGFAVRAPVRSPLSSGWVVSSRPPRQPTRPTGSAGRCRCRSRRR